MPPRRRSSSEGRREAVALHAGAKVESGPEGRPAVMLRRGVVGGAPVVARSTAIRPFSIAQCGCTTPRAMAIKGTSWPVSTTPTTTTVAGTSGSAPGNSAFRMTGEQGGVARIGPANTQRMEADKWTHIVVTHDGSGERAGTAPVPERRARPGIWQRVLREGRVAACGSIARSCLVEG